MICDECGNGQRPGGFCGHCGARMGRPDAPTRSGRSLRGRCAGPSGRGFLAGLAVAAALAVPGVLAVLAVPALVPVGPDRAAGPDTPRGGDAGAHAPAAHRPTSPDVSPEVRDEPAADTVLVFDDGRDGAVTVDFDEGVLERSELPGQRPGERPFRLLRLGQRLVVGSDRVWAVRPGSGTSQQLGRGTAFLPDARPDRLWLVDDPVGGDAAGAPIWTLIDDTGAVLHRAVGRETMVPVRGVPNGLALATEHGLKVYDVRTRGIFFYVGAPHGRISDVAEDRVAWCRPGCDRLTVTGPDHDPTTVGADEILGFESGSVWLSPDGVHVAAVTDAVAPGTGPIRQVLVFDVDAAEVRSRRRLPAGDVHGSWSVDGRRFFYAVARGGDRVQLGRYRVGRAAFEVRVHPHLDALGGFVALPRAAVEGQRPVTRSAR